MGTKPIELPGVKTPPPLPGAVGDPQSVKMSPLKPENKNAVKTISLMRYDAAEAFNDVNPTKVFESETGSTFNGTM